MKITAFIPARYASTRFPGKPLASINGKTMIRRVYERASAAFSDVYVATDDVRIAREVESFGGKYVMTSPDHCSGTDRCLEAVCTVERETGNRPDIVVNVQGDEPYIEPKQLEQLVSCFDRPGVEISTLVKKIHSADELTDANTPKVVKSLDGYAIYFSRTPIPYFRGKDISEWLSEAVYYKHIGLYAYRRDVLERIASMPVSGLEKAERLEQLRWLENGLKIAVYETEYETLSVDVPEDISRLEDKFHL